MAGKRSIPAIIPARRQPTAPAGDFFSFTHRQVASVPGAGRRLHSAMAAQQGPGRGLTHADRAGDESYRLALRPQHSNVLLLFVRESGHGTHDPLAVVVRRPVESATVCAPCQRLLIP